MQSFKDVLRASILVVPVLAPMAPAVAADTEATNASNHLLSAGYCTRHARQDRFYQQDA